MVARGQGIDAPYWPTAKPYQPDSIEFAPYTFAVSGPVRIDGDRDGRYSSAYEYAHRLIDRCEGETARVIEQLESYDRAVAIQAAAILWAQSGDGEPSANALANSSDTVRSAFSEYRRVRRQSISARLEQDE